MQAISTVIQLSDCCLFVNPGAHLEGPFLNPDMKGAHKAHLMRQISTKGAQEMEDFYGTLDHVSIVTLAPELAGENMESIKQLVQRNIVVSIGKLRLLLITLKVQDLPLALQGFFHVVLRVLQQHCCC